MIYKIYTDKYVAAILSSTVDLGDWLTRVPHKLCETLKVEMLTGQYSYPVTLIEYEFHGERSFIHAQNVERMKRDLRNLGRKVLTTYTIEKDFIGDPKNPGEDYMGILPHEHEEEDEVSN